VIPGPGVLVLASGGWLDGVPLATCTRVCVAVAEGVAVGALVSWGGDEGEGVAVGVLVSGGGDEAEGVGACGPAPVAVDVAGTGTVGVADGRESPVAVGGTGVSVGLSTGVGVLVKGTVWRSGSCSPRAHARSPAGSDAASQAVSIMITRMAMILRYFITQTPTVKQVLLKVR
jgi:hypothetical protein